MIQDLSIKNIPGVKSHKKELLAEIHHLTKIYGSGDYAIHAVDAIDLKIYKGELLVVFGKSGSGKSTLLNLLGGMDAADEGSILFHNTDVVKMNEKQLTAYRRDKIGFVFQFYNLIQDLTASENTRLAANLSNVPFNEKSIFEMMDLTGKEDCYPSEMSGGQQQRVAIARAIVKGAEFILCDEPTGALDTSTGIQILKVLEDLSRKQGLTVMIVTHMEQIASIADRIIRMNSGKIVEEIENLSPLPADELEV